jgi:TonB family protein
MRGEWMRGTVRLISLVAVLAAGSGVCAFAQETAKLPAPKPDTEGVYFVGPLVTAPRLTKTIAAGYPTGIRTRDIPGFTVLSLVVDEKGLPTRLEVLHSHGKEFDASATNAVKLCKFAPGMLMSAGAAPVPVRIDLRVSFHSNGAQAVPAIVIAERDLAPPELTAKQARQAQSYTPPIPIHIVDADFFDPAAKSQYDGVALVTVTVNTEGLPVKVQMRRGLGFGTDAKAIAAVKQYRFLPATSKGKPIEASREVEVKFSIL